MEDSQLSNMDGRWATMVDELLENKESSDGELPPPLLTKRPRGGRRARNRNKWDSASSTPCSAPPSTTSASVHSLHLSKVPFMLTGGDIASTLAPFLSTLFKGAVHVTEMIPYRSKRSDKGCEKGATPTSVTPVTSEQPSCNASLVYNGPPPMGLPVTVHMSKEGHLTDTSAPGGYSVVIESSQASLQILRDPVITLYGKVYTLDAEPPAGKALSVVIAGITEISLKAAQCIKCTSHMSTSKHTKVQKVHLTQVLIECANIQDAELLRETINEKKVTVNKQVYLYSVEYTSEKQGDTKVNMARPLFVSKEHRLKPPSEWPAEALAAREESAHQVAEIRDAWINGRELLLGKPSSPCSTTTAFTTPTHRASEHVPVLDFPSDPSDGQSILSSQHSTTSTHPSQLGTQDVAPLVKAALAAVTNSVDLPWNQKAAVMMGAAAYAVVSGHYQPATTTATRDESWLNLVNQLNISLPASTSTSTPPGQGPGLDSTNPKIRCVKLLNVQFTDSIHTAAHPLCDCPSTSDGSTTASTTSSTTSSCTSSIKSLFYIPHKHLRNRIKADSVSFPCLPHTCAVLRGQQLVDLEVSPPLIVVVLVWTKNA